MSGVNKGKKALLQATYFICAIVLACGKTNGISPFSSALLYAAQFFSFSPFFSVISFIAGEIITIFSWRCILYSVLGAFPLFLVVIIKGKKKSSKYALATCCVFHAVVRFFAYLHLDLVYLAINAMLTLCFSYVFYLTLGFLSAHSHKQKLTDSETACLLLTIIALSVGLSSVCVFSVSQIYIVSGFLVIGVTWSVGRGSGMLCALAMGSGYAFNYFDVSLMALFPFCSLCASMFVSSRRIFSFFSAVMAFTVFDMYFMGVSQYFAVKLAFFSLGMSAFLCVPSSIVLEWKNSRLANDGNVAVRYLVNRNRFETAKRIASLKEVFEKESEILSSLKTDNKHAVSRLAGKIEAEVCASCESYSKCKKKGLDSALSTLARHTVVKNKTAIASLPPLLEDECIRLATLVGSAHNRSLEIKKDLVEINTQNKIKASLASSLKGVRDILAREEICVGAPIGFDYEREEKIRDELALFGVTCSQALVALGNDFSITLLVKRETYDKEKVENALKSVLKVQVKVLKSDDSVIRGWLVVELIQKPLLGAMVGVSSQSKVEGANGDAHSFVKLSEGRYLCALCDGMGSGEKAGETADKALSLIENFYKAGFEHSLTIKSVNEFLRVDCDDGFSALDVMIFDAYEERVDIIKLASPPCYLKKSNHTIRIDGASLPLGIVGEISPSISSRRTEVGDCFVFVSDGVADSFRGDELSAFINNSDARNPQLFSHLVLEEAKKRNVTGKKDDMTVIVLVVFNTSV